MRSRRPFINPNAGFLLQLSIYEVCVCVYVYYVCVHINININIYTYMELSMYVFLCACTGIQLQAHLLCNLGIFISCSKSFVGKQQSDSLLTSPSPFIAHTSGSMLTGCGDRGRFLMAQRRVGIEWSRYRS